MDNKKKQLVYRNFNISCTNIPQNLEEPGPKGTTKVLQTLFYGA